jgi:hypothetical protein
MRNSGQKPYLGDSNWVSRDGVSPNLVAGNPYFATRRVQFATLAAKHGIPASYPNRANVEAGGLTSYGTDNREAYRQVGVYIGQILKGAKPDKPRSEVLIAAAIEVGPALFFSLLIITVSFLPIFAIRGNLQGRSRHNHDRVSKLDSLRNCITLPDSTMTLVC